MGKLPSLSRLDTPSRHKHLHCLSSSSTLQLTLLAFRAHPVQQNLRRRQLQLHFRATPFHSTCTASEPFIQRCNGWRSAVQLPSASTSSWASSFESPPAATPIRIPAATATSSPP